MTHLLVTNDFPPKVGGIQTYLWELWRRLPPGEFGVLTAAHAGSDAWDRAQPFRIERVSAPVLLPQPGLAGRIQRSASSIGADLVVLDPALPLGLIGRRLDLPYAVVLHGAEVTVPGRIPVARGLLASVLSDARGVIAAGGYPEAEGDRALGRRMPDTVIVPPGVDLDRFHPVAPERRAAIRTRLGLPSSGPLVVSASRLVPRKGIDTVIEALAHLVPHVPDLLLAVAGSGRDADRLATIAGRHGVAKKVTFLGRIPDADLADLYAVADVFAMLCRSRWGGLEQEGFGIVFMEAAACGVPQIAGDSGGAAEAVEDGVTGIVLTEPDAEAAAAALRRLLGDAELRTRMGAAARARAEKAFGWDALAADLLVALRKWSP